MITNPFSAPIWKLVTGVAGVVALILSALLISSYMQNRSLTQQRAVLQAQINDPETGYVVRLAQARTNVATLEVALETQRRSFQTKEAQRNAILADTERQLRAAQAQTRVMQVKLERFLATKPQGATLEDRIRDIDARALKEFVQ